MVEAFEVDQPLVVAEVVAASTPGPSLDVWWHGSRTRRPQRVKLRTRQLTPQPGPEPKPPLSMNIKHKPVEQKTMLRLLAPQHYRGAFLSKGSDTPASVISGG